MKKVYDLAVKTGSYQKDGETKNRYKNVGSVMEGDNGMFMFLDKSFNPAGIESKEGSSDIIVSMFAPRQKEETKGSPDGSSEPFSDQGIPF